MTDILIVIPAYNSVRFLRQCMDSVIQQTYPNWRLVVVDDGSSDATATLADEVAQSDSRITVVRQQNGGVASARNRGLTYLSDSIDYVMCLDNDDFLYPDTLEFLKKQLIENPSCVAAYGMPKDVDEAGATISEDITQSYGFTRHRRRSLVPLTSDSELVDLLSFVSWDCIATPGQVLMRRSTLDIVGNFDQTTAPSDDWDMWIRLTLIGPMVCANRFVLNKRYHGEMVSGKGRLMAGAEPALRSKLATSPHLTKEQYRIAKRGHLHSCAIKLSWARNDLKKRKVVAASKTTVRAVLSYVRYLRTPYRA